MAIGAEAWLKKSVAVLENMGARKTIILQKLKCSISGCQTDIGIKLASIGQIAQHADARLEQKRLRKLFHALVSLRPDKWTFSFKRAIAEFLYLS